MPTPILASKLALPLLRPNLISRPRLIQRLAAELWQPGGFTRRLTLVTAPAGYGKTTLVVEWLRGTQQRAAWLSLDGNDNDPARFLAYLIAALEGLEANSGKSLRKLLRTPQLPPELFLTALVNELNRNFTPFLLTLDDMHLIQAPAIYQQLSFLIEHQPSNMHLVILSREDPPLPIGRLRANGEMVDIRQSDLCFTLGETREFLRRAAGLELLPEALQMLAERTEGWAVGLQLAALALQETIPTQGGKGIQAFVEAFASSKRYILDYLFEEVLAKQAQAVQEFLLKTSILERMCAPLCDAVVGTLAESDAHGAKVVQRSEVSLEHLERSNLFLLPLDHQREWYRYHPLFQELLRNRLRVTAGVLETGLHERASRWLAQNGYMEEAVEHALSAKDWGTSATLLGQVSGALLTRGEFGTLTSWFKRLPEAMVRSHPELCLGYAWALLLIGQLEAAEALLVSAETLAAGEREMAGRIATAKAYLAQVRGDGRKLIAESERALALLPVEFEMDRGLVALSLGMAYWNIGRLAEAENALNEALHIARKTANDYAAASALIFLARCQAVRGKLRLAEKKYLEYLESGPQVSSLVMAYLDLGAIYMEWNDFVQAARSLQQGLALARASGNTEFQIAGLILQACIQFNQADFPGAAHAIRQALQIDAAGLAPQRAALRLTALQVELALAAGDIEEASRLGQDLPSDVDWHPFYRFLGLTKARLLLAQGQKGEAARHLQACCAAAEKAGWGYGALAARVLQAVAAETTRTALDFLTEALNRAQPEKYIRTFVEAGEAFIPLLQQAVLQGTDPAYIRDILAALGEKYGGRAPGGAGLVEPLGERELEVLRLVAAGLSNRQIAARLVLSLNTVKSHVHHLCAKLEAGNRTHLAARARQLNLL